MWHSFAKTVWELRRTYGKAFDAYRPELHYMRGPGPKCRAKRFGATVAPASPAAANARPALGEIAEAHA